MIRKHSWVTVFGGGRLDRKRGSDHPAFPKISRLRTPLMLPLGCAVSSGNLNGYPKEDQTFFGGSPNRTSLQFKPRGRREERRKQQPGPARKKRREKASTGSTLGPPVVPFYYFFFFAGGFPN